MQRRRWTFYEAINFGPFTLGILSRRAGRRRASIRDRPKAVNHPPEGSDEQGSTDQDDKTGRKKPGQEFSRITRFIGLGHLFDAKDQKEGGQAGNEYPSDPPEHFPVPCQIQNIKYSDLAQRSTEF